jgi:hypothetical protein
MCPPSDGESHGAGVDGSGLYFSDKNSLPKATGPPSNGGQSSSSSSQQTRQRYGSMDTRSSQEQSQDRQTDPSSDADPRQRPRKERRPSDKQRICGKCQRHLTGQFVRALGDTYHLECFTCHVRTLLICKMLHES